MRIQQIYVSDEKSRYAIVSKSDAYSMDRILSKDIEDEYILISIPVKNLQAEFFVLTGSKETTDPILQEFINFLEKRENVFRFF